MATKKNNNANKTANKASSNVATMEPKKTEVKSEAKTEVNADIEAMRKANASRNECNRLYAFYEAAYYNELSQEEYDTKLKVAKFTITVDEAFKAHPELCTNGANAGIQKYVKKVEDDKNEGIIALEKVVADYEAEIAKVIVKNMADDIAKSKNNVFNKIKNKFSKTDVAGKSAKDIEVADMLAEEEEDKFVDITEADKTNAAIGTINLDHSTKEYRVIKSICKDMSDEWRALKGKLIPEDVIVWTHSDGIGNYWTTLEYPDGRIQRFTMDPKVTLPSQYGVVWTEPYSNITMVTPINSPITQKLVYGLINEISPEDKAYVLQFLPFKGAVDPTSLLAYYDFRGAESINELDPKNEERLYRILSAIVYYMAPYYGGNMPRLRFVNFESQDNFSVVSDDRVLKHLENFGAHSPFIDNGLRIEVKDGKMIASKNGNLLLNRDLNI